MTPVFVIASGYPATSEIVISQLDAVGAGPAHRLLVATADGSQFKTDIDITCIGEIIDKPGHLPALVGAVPGQAGVAAPVGIHFL